MRIKTRMNTYSEKKYMNLKNNNFKESAQSKRIISFCVIIFYGLIFSFLWYTGGIERLIVILIWLVIFVIIPIILYVLWLTKPNLAISLANKSDSIIHAIYLFILYNLVFGAMLNLGFISGFIISFFLCLLFFHSRNNIYYKDYFVTQAWNIPNIDINNCKNSIKYYKNDYHENIIKRKIFDLYFSHFKKKNMLAFYISYIVGYFILFILFSSFLWIFVNLVLILWSILVWISYYKSYKKISNIVYSQKNNFILTSLSSKDVVYVTQQNKKWWTDYILSNNKYWLK